MPRAPSQELESAARLQSHYKQRAKEALAAAAEREADGVAEREDRRSAAEAAAAEELELLHQELARVRTRAAVEADVVRRELADARGQVAAAAADRCAHAGRGGRGAGRSRGRRGDAARLSCLPWPHARRLRRTLLHAPPPHPRERAVHDALEQANARWQGELDEVRRDAEQQVGAEQQGLARGHGGRCRPPSGPPFACSPRGPPRPGRRLLLPYPLRHPQHCRTAVP